MNKPGKISNEELLLLELCRLEFDDSRKARLDTLAGQAGDWKYFSELAIMHGVSALAFYNLENNKLLRFVPAEICHTLKATMLKSISRNVFLTESVTDVLGLLNKKNIKTVLLKGMALEKTIYGNRGLRQMNDIDILVERNKCLQARKILTGNGFVSLPVKSLFHSLILDRIGKHLPSLIKNGASVEIHHELFTDRLHTLTEKVIKESQSITINGEKASVPSPRMFFLYLVRHLEKHETNGESQLRLYTDLVVLMEKHYEEIINPGLLSLAAGAGMEKTLAGYFHLLREFWSLHFPDWLNNFINERNISGISGKFLFFLRSPKNEPADRHGVYRQVVSEIPGLHRKIIFVLGDVFPSLSFMKKRYKCSRKINGILYYPHRLGKLWWLIH